VQSTSLSTVSQLNNSRWRASLFVRECCGKSLIFSIDSRRRSTRLWKHASQRKHHCFSDSWVNGRVWAYGYGSRPHPASLPGQGNSCCLTGNRFFRSFKRTELPQTQPIWLSASLSIFLLELETDRPGRFHFRDRRLRSCAARVGGPRHT
jgi:hypothetical protein